MRAQASTFQLVDKPITVHAFNKNRTELALCPNNNDIHIYRKSGPEWILAHVLKQHDSVVTGIDWAPNTNKIVSCSQDRNAYVWNYEQEAWKPLLVLLRIQRSATCVAFSPSEDKLAVGTGMEVVAVCHYQKEENWWISKHLKKGINGTVLSLTWHPNNILLAVGCTDGTATVVSAFTKGVDEKPESCSWGDRLPFGQIVGAFPSPYHGFVHDVSFSPSGNSLVFAAHDSTVTVVNAPDQHVSIECSCSPFKVVVFLTEDLILAAGYDNHPFLIKRNGNSWEFSGKIQTGQESEMSPTRSANSAFAKFKQMDSRAQSGPRRPSGVSTLHQNTITCIRPFDPPGSGNPAQYSITGLDGKLSILDFAGLPDIGGMRVR